MFASNRLAFTPGEPAGIGPDLAVALASHPLARHIVVVADPELLQQRAQLLGQPLTLVAYRGEPIEWRPGQLALLPVQLQQPVVPGRLNPRHSPYVLETLRRAVRAIEAKELAGLVTGPVHKGVINDAGVAFSGHTEFLADLAAVEKVVMMLATPWPPGFAAPHWRSEALRVALVTTHLPLKEVAAAVTATALQQTITITHRALQRQLGVAQPHILVAGLNPHAGESGHLGREELEVMIPQLQQLRQQGIELDGPLPADTLFTRPRLANCDAVVACYHDQGLAVLKCLGFGQAVNITLGLPFVRTSVDHGTALELAGRGGVDSRSLYYAIEVARQMAGAERANPGGGGRFGANN
ncbi:4-hydroxythreonine-4-phosphate dehydrogenase PdxA [Ectothiorhodospiraceae bacterium BW-2]|nr:4-hydroxythreonine-4-phosphate dehydrogenase PdxA [Ectothiorhodospiraceae bacterium BW-2]